MELQLFSDRSIMTMFHGIVLGGGALLGLGAAMFYLVSTPVTGSSAAAFEAHSRAMNRLMLIVGVVLWIAVVQGTYFTFPPYRATPPDGTLDLSYFPRALINSSPQTSWLHGFGMEVKEHMPWVAAMLVTAVAFVGRRDRGELFADSQRRRMSFLFLSVAFVLVAFVALLGTFINKVAPLE